MNFDKSKLTEQDYVDLNGAISRAAPRVRFWYNLPNTFMLEGRYNIDKGECSKLHFIKLDRIAEETGATCDYDKLHKDHSFMREDRYSTKKIGISDAFPRGFRLGKLFGFKDVDICAYNPSNPLPNVSVGKRKAELVQIDGLGWGNTYDARVNFERGTACFNQEDQDIAHRLGLEYFPTGIMKIDSLKPSDSSLHSKKPGQKEGKPIIYCDNPCCGGELKSPEVVVEEITGGVYHSSTCFWKDVGTKRYLAREREDIDLSNVEPVKVSLEHALFMYSNGELQQSRDGRKVDSKDFRKVEMWPEAAVLFH